MKTVLFWILVGVGAAGVASVVIKNRVCNKGPDANTISTSTEISVKPCQGGEPCVVRKGLDDVTIKIKFIPHLQGDESIIHLKSTLAWLNGGKETILGGLKQHACASYIKCPLKNEKVNIFNATFPFGENLAAGTYNLKLKIQEPGASGRVVACQLFRVKLETFNENESFIVEFI